MKYYFVTIQHRTDIELVNNEKLNIFELEHYFGITLPIQKTLEIRSLLELYLFLIATILFLLNGPFIILSSINV